MKDKILKANSFDEARCLFIAACENKISKNEQLNLLKYLDCKVETPADVCIMIEFYKLLNDKDAILKYVKNCMYRDVQTVRSKIISIESQYGSIRNAGLILKEQKINDYTITQKAAYLNKTGNPDEARILLEQQFLTHISKYSIKTYASIINKLLKTDEYACDLCIPNLARDICKEESVSSFDANRLLKKLYKYENNLGNKKESKILEKILENFHYEG
jgi:hypothetical protein